MSRYIDADALEYDTEWSEYHDGFTAYSQMAIDTAPSIDIVRCKECKKANTEHCSHSYWDDDWGEWRVGYKGEEWFCADGERDGE